MTPLPSHPPLTAERLCQLEVPFHADGYAGVRTAGPARYVPSTTGVLITAPHAVNHIRGLRVKRADRGTGAVATAVAEATGAGLLVATRVGLDGAWYPTAPWHRQLQAALGGVHTVIDVHGMVDREDDICLGRGPDRGRSADLADRIRSAATGAGLRVGEDVPFPARRPACVTAVAHRAGVAAVQVELAARHRVPDDPGAAARVVDLLVAVVTAVIADSGSVRPD